LNFQFYVQLDRVQISVGGRQREFYHLVFNPSGHLKLRVLKIDIATGNSNVFGDFLPVPYGTIETTHFLLRFLAGAFLLTGAFLLRGVFFFFKALFLPGALLLEVAIADLN
jgi:hypothetical protein